MSRQNTAKKEMDMLSGTLWNKILLFAIPLAASSILQQLFNSADMAVVGRFAGKEALAAVGSNSSLINLLVNLFVGLSIGANVVIAKYLGENNRKKARKAAHTAIVLSVISGIIIMILGIIIARPVLRLMSCPSDVIDLSTIYLRIYFLGMPFIMFYNFGSAILRSQGDTNRPFLCLLVSGIVNILLNLFFVIVCKLSVAGVAIATVISNIVSAGMLYYFLTHQISALRIKPRELKISKTLLSEIVKIGVPAGVQGVVFSLSNLCIQSALNKLGSDYVAASAAALNFEFYVYFLLNAFTQACVTFTGQNYGAKDYKRCTRITLWCFGLALLFTSILNATFVVFGGKLIKFYTTEPIVIEIGLQRMKYVLAFQFLNIIMDILSGTMRGMGYSLAPAIVSACGACGIRLIWVYTVFEKSPTFITLMRVYPVSWAVTSVAMLITYFAVRRIAMKPKITTGFLN